MTPYDSLAAHLRQITALEQIGGVLNWDQETMMPRKGAAQRAEQMGALETILHGLRSDPRLAEWAETAVAPNDAGTVNIAQARRIHARATRVPADLAAEIARVTSESQGVWAAARKAKRFADFAPTLSQVLSLKRQEAEAVRTDGQDRYAALLEEYEPEMDTATLGETLEALRPGLVELRERIAGSDTEAPVITGHFPADAQMKLAHRIASTTGYDIDEGRLDLAVHPFSSGSGTDVRITTRIDETEPLGCIYSTMHECGHALYELGIDPGLHLQPAGRWTSMGIHESQSRCLENQIGRSRAFCDWLYPAMRDAFGDFGIAGPDALYRAVNRVESGYVRTEADEVHYNLHVILRFGLERALIEGALDVADLEEAWNARFEASFGVAVPDAAMGVLQDVHWPVGLFGYFPTYSLGNLYAGCLFEAMQRDLPDLDNDLSSGNLAPALNWQRNAVHQHGSLKTATALIETVTGATAGETALLTYLNRKYGALYSV